MKTFEIEIISPERVIFKGTAQSLVLPAFEGKLGVLAGHMPAVVQLVPGEVKVDSNLFAISGGFAEILQKKTWLFVDTAEIAEEINVERARLALERARTSKTPAGVQKHRARLKVAQAAAEAKKKKD